MMDFVHTALTWLPEIASVLTALGLGSFALLQKKIAKGLAKHTGIDDIQDSIKAIEKDVAKNKFLMSVRLYPQKDDVITSDYDACKKLGLNSYVDLVYGEWFAKRTKEKESIKNKLWDGVERRSIRLGD